MTQLPVWVSIAQIVASVFLALAALIVGIASAVFTYRNNFGWAPVILTIDSGVLDKPDTRRSEGGWPRDFVATIEFQIWNRHKYPIHVGYLNVEFKSLELIADFNHLDKTQPHIYSTFMDWPVKRPIAPMTSETFNLEIPFTLGKEYGSLEDISTSMTIRASYFDPRNNRRLSVQTNSGYGFARN